MTVKRTATSGPAKHTQSRARVLLVLLRTAVVLMLLPLNTLCSLNISHTDTRGRVLQNHRIPTCDQTVGNLRPRPPSSQDRRGGHRLLLRRRLSQSERSVGRPRKGSRNGKEYSNTLDKKRTQMQRLAIDALPKVVSWLMKQGSKSSDLRKETK